MQPQLSSNPVASSERARELPRSGIRKIYNAARELESQGIDVIRLDIGDPDYELPGRITEATHNAMLAGQTHYSPMIGLPEARSAIATHMGLRFGMPGDESSRLDHIVVNQGATQGLNSALQLACGIGQSVILPEIYWPNYIQQVTLAGITPRFYRLDDHFQPVLEDLERLCDETTRAVLVNTPSNPTGALFPPQTVRAIYDFAASRNLWVISDEAYCDFVYEGEHLSPLQLDWELAPEQRRVLAVFSFSKSYAATGLRLGWTIAPRADVTLQLATMNEPLTGSLTTPLQFGMAVGLTGDDAVLRRDGLRARWKLAGEILRESGLPFDPPAGGLFYFIDISATGMGAGTFAPALL
ncbi:MAG: pyridoxal phosphate-dependent aminotransferase, partial [bacterium]|nr:pyridoxal phosphate-dependent aminotransferase [bacterium]